MTTQTLSRFPSSTAFFPTQTRRHRSPFLEALKHVRYGHLVINTPEGERLEFSGRQNGPEGYLRLYDWGVFDDLIARGEMGFVEAYMDERWETTDLPALLTFALVNNDALQQFFYGKPWYALWVRLKYLLRGHARSAARRNVMAHYNLGNDFYALWLDNSMTYSGALFEGNSERSLEAAQAAKYRRILNKLQATPGQHVLDIGCGWGGFAEAAARDGLRVTAITLSEPQAQYAKARLAKANLDRLASVELMDYRDVTGTFDHIVSIGMFEHVGEEWWPAYFRTIRDHLKPGGTAMVQSITLDDRLFETLHDCHGFIDEIIFPGGCLPSKSRFRQALAKEGLNCMELFAFGQDYALTLRNWLARFEERKAEVIALGYDKPFLRLWRFYLASCIASFESHRTDVMQVEITQAV